MLLRIISNYFVAGCVWKKNSYHNWECVEAAPIIHYIVGMTPPEVESYIKKKKWKYEWLTQETHV